jgi:hypothetical protein
MFEELSARSRAALRRGAEGAARLRGEWLNAGREAYGHAIREGRDVVARTESELETLGRKALAEKARLKAAARNSLDEVRRGVEAGPDRVDRVAGDVRQGVQEAVKVVVRGAQGGGKATARLLGDAAGQVTASQPMEREIVRAMGPAARDLVGKTWNAPNTLVGLAYGGAGHVAGLALGTEPYVTAGANAIQFRNNPLGGVGAITLGNTTTYSGDPSDPRSEWGPYNAKYAAPIWEHERQHTIQGEQLGPLYLPSNLAGGMLALIRDRNEEGEPDWHGPSNWNERGPQETSPRPWPRRRRP